MYQEVIFEQELYVFSTRKCSPMRPRAIYEVEEGDIGDSSIS